MRTLTMAVALLICLGCEPVGHALEEEVDLLPPVFQGIAATGPNTVAVHFDEPVTVAADAVRIEPPLTVREVGAGAGAGDSDGEAVVVVVTTELSWSRKNGLHDKVYSRP